MKEEIKLLHQLIKDTAAFYNAHASKFGIEPISMKNNWFGRLYSIPKKHQKEVLELLKEEVELQKAAV